MRFKFRPVHSFEDVTADLEQIETHQWTAAELAAGAAASNVGTLGGKLSGTLPNPGFATGVVLELLSTGTTRKIAYGSQNAVFAAVPAVATFINHGLGVTPVAYGAIADRNGAAIPQLLVDSGGGPTSTQIRIDLGTAAGGNTTGTWIIRWWAIG